LSDCKFIVPAFFQPLSASVTAPLTFSLCFIQPQAGGKDVFVHIERAGLSGLNEGQVVEYEEVANKGKTSAENLKVQR
jgi:cold shock protein